MDLMKATDHRSTEWTERRLFVNFAQTDGAVHTKPVIAPINCNLL